jgi:hypothetical protein
VRGLVKGVALVAGALLIILLIIAAVPDKDCAGNNTWKTSEVCKK